MLVHQRVVVFCGFPPVPGPLDAGLIGFAGTGLALVLSIDWETYSNGLMAMRTKKPTPWRFDNKKRTWDDQVATWPLLIDSHHQQSAQQKQEFDLEGKRFIWIYPDEMMLLMMKFLEQIELPTTAKFPLVLPWSFATWYTCRCANVLSMKCLYTL